MFHVPGTGAGNTVAECNMADPNVEDLKQTPLHEVHVASGAKMVPFAGYQMPVQYADGVMKEHTWTRQSAGLFDVSHMGQAELVARDGRHETVARALETLVPADIVNLPAGRQRYTQLLNSAGGIIDDLMVARPHDDAKTGTLALVVNAARKDVDFAHLRTNLGRDVELRLPDPDRALIALQGPHAEAALLAADAHFDAPLEGFMQAATATLAGIPCHVTRSGYTGEDGFEIAIAAEDASRLWQALSNDDRVKPIGLGARDSLRLEAGLCLYGHDIDETTSPIEAGLAWSIQKRRRAEKGFPGADRIVEELAGSLSRRRVGLKPEGRAPAREGTEIRAADGTSIGTVTSGGYGPTVAGPVAMGYVASSHAATGTAVSLIVRGKALPATVVDLPFTPHRYKRAGKN